MIDAMKQALEALDGILESDDNNPDAWEAVKSASTALRLAIEQAERQDAVEDVKVYQRMYEQNTELKKINAQLLKALGLVVLSIKVGPPEYDLNDTLEIAEGAIAAAKGGA